MNKTIGIWALVAAVTGCGGSVNRTSAQTPTGSYALTSNSSVPPSGGANSPKSALAVSVRTADARSLAPASQFSTSFSITGTNTLYFAAEISGSCAGHHTASFQVNLPDGSTYQEINLSFATDTAADAAEQQAEKTDTGYRVWVSIPVAGTSIEQFHFVGRWETNVTLDGAVSPNAAAVFNLN